MRKINSLLFPLILITLAFNTLAAVTIPPRISTEEKQLIVVRHIKAIAALLKSADIQRCIVEHLQHLLSLVAILKIDQQWPKQQAQVSSVLNHTCAKPLKAMRNDTAYQFSEFMLTDSLGALVVATPTPSDYWQADEEKFIQPTISGKNYISEEDWDASTGNFSFFISIPIIQSGQFFGVMISGINVTAEYLNKLSLQELMNINVEL